MPRLGLSLVVLFTLLTLVACGDAAGQPAPAQPGNAENGKALFNQPSLANGPSCATCHALEPNKVVVGPSLAAIGARASEIIQRTGYTGTATNPAEYLRESIASPDLYAEEGFTPGVMPDTDKDLTASELDDLVAYLLTLK
jgi:cytochrome c2